MSGRFQSNLVERNQFDRPGGLKNRLNQKELIYIKDSFKLHDTNKTNEIDIDELKQALDKFGIEYSNDESLQKIFNDAEKNGSTNLDFDQLINAITSRMEDIDSMSELQKVFCLFLGDENVDKIEFKHIRKECPFLTDEEIKEMIEKADEDKDGKINFEEFDSVITPPGEMLFTVMPRFERVSARFFI